MKKKNFNIILISSAIIMAVIACVVIAGVCMPEPEEVIQGQAETSDYRVSSKIPGRILEIRVAEGDAVAKGDTLVILEAPDIDAKLAQAEAAFEAARAVEQKALTGARREQIQSAYEVWQKAIAGREVAEKTYARVNRLFENGVMAEQKRDEALANFRAMQASENAARSQYEMAVNGTRTEDISAARAQVSRARGAVSEVTSYVGETVLTASADGVVTEIFPEQGELVGTGAPIMNVARTDDTFFTFNVREDYLPGLTVGTEAEVYVPAFDKTVKVRVTRIKDVGSFAAWKATKALDKFDLKTFEVQAYPVDPSELTGLRGGMTAVLRGCLKTNVKQPLNR